MELRGLAISRIRGYSRHALRPRANLSDTFICVILQIERFTLSRGREERVFGYGPKNYRVEKPDANQTFGSGVQTTASGLDLASTASSRTCFHTGQNRLRIFVNCSSARSTLFLWVRKSEIEHRRLARVCGIPRWYPQNQSGHTTRGKETGVTAFFHDSRRAVSFFEKTTWRSSSAG